MKNAFMRKVTLISATLAVACSAGCASVTVTSTALEDRTAFALGLEKGKFTIANRMDEGTTTRYTVTTASGKKFNCSVGGSITVLGSYVTDAICTEIGKSSDGGASSIPCNALLKAAGKC